MFFDYKNIMIQGLSNQLQALEAERRKIEKPAKDIEFQISEMGPVDEVKKFSFIEKHFTKRSEYKKFNTVSTLKSTLISEKAKASTLLEEKNITNQINELYAQINSFESSKSFSDLGVSISKAISTLLKNGITPILDNSDKITSEVPKNYSTLQSIVGVHKTDYPPKNNEIKTTKASGAKYRTSVTINGIQHEYLYDAEIDSVHMSLNNEVSSHEFGNWDNKKIAVIIPITKIPKENFGAVEVADTFTKGNLNLATEADMEPVSYILCQENKINSMKKSNPMCIIIGYKGEAVSEYIRPLISQLGYHTEDVTKNGWLDRESTDQFNQLAKKENLPRGLHANTHFYEDLKKIEKINEAVSICRLLHDNRLISSNEDYVNIQDQLAHQGKDFGTLLSGICDGTIYSNDPESIVGQKQLVNIFLDKMNSAGMTFNPVYAKVLQNLCNTTMSECNKTNADYVCQTDGTMTMEEISNINALKTALSSNSSLNFDNRYNALGKFISNAMMDTLSHAHNHRFDMHMGEE